MYKVMIVDDEPVAVIGIKMTFNWEEYGFVVVGDTTDAYEAIEIAEKLNPDVIFTDVVMPDMTGLDLIKKLRNRAVDAEVVIISGHNDFLFTKQAIQQGLFDYCLKPIKKSEADELLDRLKVFLDAKNGVSIKSDDNEIKNDRLRKIVEYIKSNFADGVKLSKLAERFEINSNYLSTIFKQETGVNFSQYITNVRMEAAEEYLKHTEITVEEIAQKVGMEYYYFMNLFKRIHKMTPKQFRERFSEK